MIRFGSRYVCELVALAVLLPCFRLADARTSVPPPPRPANELQCPIETVNPSQKARARAEADAKCGVDSGQLMSLLQKPGVLAVDVRSPHARQSSRIPDAVQWSYAELKTQHGVRSRSLLLVGDGKDDSALLEQCADLKARGFKEVKVLRGGVVAWVQAGRPFIADTAGRYQLQRMNASELLQSALSGDSLIFLEPAAKDYSKLLPDTSQLASSEAASIVAALKQPRTAKALDAAIIVSAKPIPDETLRMASEATRLPVFSYSGAPAEFEKFLRAQSAIWKRAEGGQRVRCPGL